MTNEKENKIEFIYLKQAIIDGLLKQLKENKITSEAICRGSVKDLEERSTNEKL